MHQMRLEDRDRKGRFYGSGRDLPPSHCQRNLLESSLRASEAPIRMPWLMGEELLLNCIRAALGGDVVKPPGVMRDHIIEVTKGEIVPHHYMC